MFLFRRGSNESRRRTRPAQTEPEGRHFELKRQCARLPLGCERYWGVWCYALQRHACGMGVQYWGLHGATPYGTVRVREGVQYKY